MGPYSYIKDTENIGTSSKAAVPSGAVDNREETTLKTKCSVDSGGREKETKNEGNRNQGRSYERHKPRRLASRGGGRGKLP